MIDGLGAFAATVALGGSIGLLQGALGAGGAILTIPALVHVLGIPLGTATVTSLVVTLANALTGSFHASRAGRALPRTGLALGMIGIGGAFVGARLHDGVDDAIVLALFSAVMLLAAATMARRGPSFGVPVDGAGPLGVGRGARMAVVGTAVGLMTGFFGVGGGFLLVPALVAALGVPMRLAPGTSMMAISLNAAWGLAAHGGGAAIDPTIATLFGGAGIAGVSVGGRLAGFVSDDRLRQAFAILVAALAVFTFLRDLPALAALVSAGA